MEKSDDKPSREKLIGQLPTPGWDMETGKSPPIRNRILEELVRVAHARHATGETAGVIKHAETKLELDLIQLQELWMHLGLPM